MNNPAETAAAVVTAVPAQVLQADAGDLRLLFRWLAAMLFIAAALAACVWTRMAVRHTALELDATRSAVTRAEIQHERLLVERSLLRDPGRLQSTAAALGLVAPVDTVTIREGQTP
jgi:cell division protein FtsL